MDYITVRQASEKWDVTMRWVQRMIKNERIPGAIRPGHDWLIPKDTPMPEDRRKYNRRQPKKFESVTQRMMGLNLAYRLFGSGQTATS